MSILPWPQTLIKPEPDGEVQALVWDIKKSLTWLHSENKAN